MFVRIKRSLEYLYCDFKEGGMNLRLVTFIVFAETGLSKGLICGDILMATAFHVILMLLLALFMRQGLVRISSISLKDQMLHYEIDKAKD